MGVKGNGQRIGIIVIVVVFFVTSLATAGFALYDMATSKNKDDSAASQQAQNQPKEGSLEGTKLAGFTPVSSVPELQKIDITPGTGEEVKPGAEVTAHYTGAVAATGVIFQSSKDTGQPVPFGLDQVIKGWTAGVPGMKVGGTRRLVIPADLAYGATPPQGSNIPANAPLVFDIELTAVTNK